MAPVSTNCVPIILKSQAHKGRRGGKNRIDFHRKASHYFLKEVLHSLIFLRNYVPTRGTTVAKENRLTMK